MTNFESTATDNALADAQRDALRRTALRVREGCSEIPLALGYKPAEVANVTMNHGPVVPLGRRMEAMAASLPRPPVSEPDNG